MTKRAGKYKYRMGSQRHPPGKKTAPDTEERLPEPVAKRMEMKAIREGWLISDDPEFQKVRQQLMRKLVSDAVTTKDPAITATIARTIAMMEQRERALEIAATRAIRAAELPQQIAPPSEADAMPADPKAIAAELLRMAEIQQAVDFSPRPPPRSLEQRAREGAPEPTNDGRSQSD